MRYLPAVIVDAVLVLVQIETREAVQNLDDILGVEGLGESLNYWTLQTWKH